MWKIHAHGFKEITLNKRHEDLSCKAKTTRFFHMYLNMMFMMKCIISEGRKAEFFSGGRKTKFFLEGGGENFSYFIFIILSFIHIYHISYLFILNHISVGNEKHSNDFP